MMCNYFVIGISGSISAIVQSIFHLLWVIYGFSWHVCDTLPSQHHLVFTYLTYFYNSDCPKIKLDGKAIFVSKDLNDTVKDSGVINEYSLYQVLEEVLEKAIFPNESFIAHRTNVYMEIFIVTDAMWIISSVVLFVGSFYNIKRISAILFYGPWLLCTAIVILLDVVGAAHFGLDITYIHNYSSWLKFIGVTNYNEFIHLNNDDKTMPIFPSVLLVVLCCRCLIFWVFNVTCFFLVFNAGVLAFQKPISSDSGCYRRPSFGTSTDANFNNSEARIRSWQMFYGTIGNNSTQSSASSNDIDYKSNNTRLNNDNYSKKQVVLKSSSPERKDNSDTFEFNSSINFQEFPIVDKNINHSTLKRHLPWSYSKLPISQYNSQVFRNTLDLNCATMSTAL